MKALGKGSIASIIRIGLMIAWVVLWIAAIGLIFGAIGYGVILILIANGMFDPNWLQDTAGSSGARAAWPVAVPALMIAATAVAGSLVIVWRLRKLFDSFSSGEPFRRENATHLRVIWITMLVIEVSRYVLMALTGVLLVHFGGPEVSANYELSIDFSAWGSILILIVLAEVFREGARLKEEQELTI